ncbi:glycosyltransferase family 4 protein [Dyadobacter sp. 676]|uniref:Glycosyltransferase family 4 protein n=1 Tax=Dyadobacter sp. 676 TaxID=3088362 RepID=A0AAU8FLV4_9BACT
MKIAQIAPLYESVPPKLYGGTERVVSYLTEELVNHGHDVTLFAAGDSETRAKLVSPVGSALRLDPSVTDPIAFHIIQMQDVADLAGEFDVLHFHTDYFHFPFTSTLPKPVLTTLHGRLDLPELQHIYRRFNRQNVVSISNHQRLPLPNAHWLDTVYHGLPGQLYKPGRGDGDYVAFIGRISREKRPDRAIEIAGRAGMKLKIAAKIDKADRQYYESTIRPLLQQPHVEFIGEIGEDLKGPFLGRAKALLFPIDWPEPFGMVMIEAMACGTPVIAFRNGSVPEVLQDGVNGFIVDSVEEAVAALDRIDLIDRREVRRCFEERFTAGVMTANYERIYARLLAKQHGPDASRSLNSTFSAENAA